MIDPAQIQSRQADAVLLSGVIEGIAQLDNDGSQPNAVTALIEVARGMADRLAQGLDSVAVSKVGGDNVAPAAPPADLLDALDDLHGARDLIDLIAMTARNNPTEEEKALSAGCAAALERLDRGIGALQAIKA